MKKLLLAVSTTSVIILGGITYYLWPESLESGVYMEISGTLTSQSYLVERMNYGQPNEWVPIMEWTAGKEGTMMVRYPSGGNYRVVTKMKGTE